MRVLCDFDMVLDSLLDLGSTPGQDQFTTLRAANAYVQAGACNSLGEVKYVLDRNGFRWSELLGKVVDSYGSCFTRSLAPGEHSCRVPLS